jgi:O-acetyl-ADP-ribose deacetylase (regulator of RNase III)
MKATVNDVKLELVQGDITEQTVDAIVNAANPSLLGGGGVDGAIHRAGGPEILAECRLLGGCATGDAKITTAGRLNARFVIHTVGPIYWQEGPERSADLLASAYQRSLEVADENHVRSVAFPSISTGAYGYPMGRAAPIALLTVIDYLRRAGGRPKPTGAAGREDLDSRIGLVRFVLWSDEAYRLFRRALSNLLPDALLGQSSD